MIQNFSVFLMSSIIFILTPGLDTIFVLNRTITQGKIAGIVSSAGIAIGVLFHTMLATLGISLIIAQEPSLFTTIKLAGAGYLIFLGILSLKAPTKLLSENHVLPTSKEKPSRTFLLALMTNILNPKVAIFFIAFFPQFVIPGSTDTRVEFLTLGSIYAILSFIWLSCLSLFLMSLSNQMVQSPKVQFVIQKLSGVIFIGLGAKIALT